MTSDTDGDIVLILNSKRPPVLSLLLNKASDLMHIGGTSMLRTTAFLILLTATVFYVGCTTADNSNTAANANVTATPANATTGSANTNNGNANVHANMNASEHANMNMSNMNMNKPNKKANANKTP